MTFPTIGRFCCTLALGSALIAAEARSQVAGDSKLDTQWQTLRALPPGEFLQVQLRTKAIIRGSIVSATDASLTLTGEQGRSLNLARSDIREIKLRRKPRMREPALGAAIGAGSGVAVIAILDGALTDGNGMSGKYAALLGAVGAGIGFLVSLGPTYTSIYKVR